MKKERIKKIAKIGGAIIFAIAIVIVANVLGIDGGVKVEAASDIELETVPVKIKNPIAIVNLDEGLVQNEKKVNYGSDLIKNISENIKVTGLGDARQGIKNGEYSAYIIIPANFSERVATINEQPAKSMLTYAMSKEIDLVEREKVLEGIVSIYNTFSNALSKVYLSSLVKEYHGVQDAASGIMDRDKLDMEKLLAVNGYDLVEIVEIPEMETVEKDVSALDLSEQYTKNSDTLSALNSSYKTSMDNGQNDYKSILDTLSGVGDYEEATATKIKDTTTGVASIKITPPPEEARKTSEEELYNRISNKITGDVGLLNTYDQDLTAFNNSVLDQSAIYDATEEYYRTFLSNLGSGYITSVTPLSIEINASGSPISVETEITSYLMPSRDNINAYKESVKQKYVTELMGMVQNAVAGIKLYYPAEPTEGEGESTEESAPQVEITDPNEKALEISKIIFEEELPYDEASYADYVENNILSDCVLAEEINITATIPKNNIVEPHIIKDGVPTYTMPQVDANTITSDLNQVIEKARKGRNERNQEYTNQSVDYQNNVDTIKQNMEDVGVAYADESALQSRSNQELSAFNMTTYIDDEGVAKYSEDLSNNNTDISQKVNENNEKYETYVTNVYDATSRNVEALKQNISEGQEKSKQKLEEGLAEAKSSRETNNQSNDDTLKAFSTRLAYTRLGELENKEVYDFIAEPIMLKNESEVDGLEKKQAKNVPEEPQKDMPGGVAAANPLVGPSSILAIPKWAWFTFGGVVLLMVGLFATIKILTHKRKEEF